MIRNIATLYLTIDEYNYLLNSNRLQPELKYMIRKFEISDTIKFSIVNAKCTYNGLCSQHKYRPFLCKLYPVYPVVDFKGNILGYEKGGIWQERLFDKNPCTVSFDRNSIDRNTQIIIKEFFQEPKNIFYFKSMEILNSAISNKITELKEEFKDASFDIFIKKVELLYLKNKIIDTGKIKEDIAKLFKQMKGYWKNNLVLDKA